MLFCHYSFNSSLNINLSLLEFFPLLDCMFKDLFLQLKYTTITMYNTKYIDDETANAIIDFFLKY